MRVVPDPSGRAKLDLAVQRMLTNLAEEIVQDAKRYAPVGSTGQLRAGIEAGPATSERVTITTSRDVPGEDPDVPIYVEYGTSKNPAQPYMRPAVYQKRAVR